MGHTIIDLSHPVTSDMVVYPGTPSPAFNQICYLNDVGYREWQITYTSHTGTHIDAPSHIMKNGKTLDQFPPGIFFGKASCIKITSDNFGQGYALKELNKLNSNISMVLFCSGWAEKWGTQKYESDYPILNNDIISCLIKRKTKLVGIDAISFDPMGSDSLLVHHQLLRNDILLLENLARLDLLVDKEFFLTCAPLPIKAVDGSPVRPLAIIE